jgi:hypothetical protein
MVNWAKDLWDQEPRGPESTFRPLSLVPGARGGPWARPEGLGAPGLGLPAEGAREPRAFEPDALASRGKRALAPGGRLARIARGGIGLDPPNAREGP